METREISQAVISRLPRYLRFLGELKDQGIERISSRDLSRLMHVTASQIRQDLNNFGGFGQQGYGYNVDYLYDEIARILGLDKRHNLIIIGAGNLGQALANYVNFDRRGFHTKGLFDSDPHMQGVVVRNMPVRPMSELEDFIRDNAIDIAVLTIPKDAAHAVADRLVRAGIRGIWNFAHVDLDVPDNIRVENVHLSDSLMKLSYNLRNCSELT
ncbi:MAG: redox-sensing transcriptional repressor Rex [Lachnospiraceae bacterium]|nr:redox-sensing transcriptional repressor Rex [Lachnospiraceae bacterium]